MSRSRFVSGGDISSKPRLALQEAIASGNTKSPLPLPCSILNQTLARRTMSRPINANQLSADDPNQLPKGQKIIRLANR
ncbi:hypothetical protein [Neorhodopirellula lusitana]|uniref:hypothetical protein n=1 Tax=Neorhodopirellula lusitana TaxID=445327 RepID=UPI0024B78554|nr:hypothetical protein [Neorhodopirellula lusitana]